MSISSISDCATLHNGVKIPWLGLGTYKASQGDEVKIAVKAALKAGYRHIDTASMYHNETGIGQAVKESGIPESEIFITSKVWNSDQGYDSTLKAFETSVKKLGVAQLGLYLIHWPAGNRYKETWKALEHLYAEGRARAIGVSNFKVHHLKDLMESAGVVPMVNQWEFHPHLVQPGLLEFCHSHHIRPEAWSPIMKGKVLEIDLLKQLGEKYSKSAVQITLRWNLQKGVVTIPKSTRPGRIASNAQIFDFELTKEEVAQIDALDKGSRIGPDPDNFV